MTRQDDRCVQICDIWLQTPTLSEYWPTIMSKYKALGFTDVIEDRTRIDEFSYILKELRKYIFTRETALRSCKELDELRALVEEYIIKAKEMETERKKLVYSILRDEWLLELHTTILNELSGNGVESMQV